MEFLLFLSITSMWQVGGDMETLLNLFSASSSSNKNLKTPDPWAMGMGHCSALLRLLPDYSDLYVAQDTWSDFSSMLKVLKRYSFDMVKVPAFPGKLYLSKGQTV